METTNNFVAISGIYLPDAIATLKRAMEAHTCEEACNRAQEARAVLQSLLKLSKEAAFELKALYRPPNETQEAEAVLKCLRLASGSTSPESEKARSAG
jgi:hypothetical protein